MSTTGTRGLAASSRLGELLSSCRVIPGVKDDRGLADAAGAENGIVFILYGNIVTIPGIVRTLKRAGKTVFVNVDLLGGSSSNDVIVRFLKENSDTDGILSSKASVLKAAGKWGFYTIHRLFIIDSFSFGSIDRQIRLSSPDCIEILPGWPKLVTWTREKTALPIISGGMICTADDVRASLEAGSIAVSSTNEEVWAIDSWNHLL